MNTSRLEAFSDGVLAIILTIMVLELKVPLGENLKSLIPYLPKLISYVLSFIYVGIYWNNHHHLFQAIEKVNGAVLWSNLHLLFWLSLLPVTSSWMNEHLTATYPVAIYGFVLLMSSLAFDILEYTALKLEGKESVIGYSLQTKRKEIISGIGYLCGIIFAFIVPEISVVIYFLIAIYWFIPDKRIERNLNKKGN